MNDQVTVWIYADGKFQPSGEVTSEDFDILFGRMRQQHEWGIQRKKPQSSARMAGSSALRAIAAAPEGGADITRPRSSFRPRP